MTKPVTFTGTIKELIANGLTMNGHKLDQPTLSVLTRLGFAKPVERIVKGRGKPATVFEFRGRSQMAFSLDPTVPSQVEPPSAAVEDVSTAASDEATAPAADTSEAASDEPASVLSDGWKDSFKG